MNVLTDLLKKNPVVLNKYVSLGFALVDKTVAPLNRFMQHLLVIQGIDPNTQPGARARQALESAIDGIEDSEEFEESFDFAPVIKAFEKTKSRLKHLQLNQDQYKKLTDLSLVDDKPQLQATKKWDPVKEEIVEYDNALDELKAFMDKYNISLSEVPLNTESARNALKILNKYNDGLKARTEKFDTARQPVTVGRGKKSRSRTKVVKNFKGCFRRVAEDKE